MIHIPYCRRKQTLPARVIAFVAWFVLLVCVMAGADTGSLIAAGGGALVGIVLFLLLQALAARMEEKYGRSAVRGRASGRTDSAPVPQPAPVPQLAPVPQPAPAGDIPLRDKKELLLRRSMEHISGWMRDNMPPDGKCEPYFAEFVFPGMPHRARLCVKCDAADPARRRLLTQVIMHGTDICMMNYMARGTRDELIAYLDDETNVEPLLVSLQHLAESIDERD